MIRSVIINNKIRIPYLVPSAQSEVRQKIPSTLLLPQHADDEYWKYVVEFIV